VVEPGTDFTAAHSHTAGVAKGRPGVQITERMFVLQTENSVKYVVFVTNLSKFRYRLARNAPVTQNSCLRPRLLLAIKSSANAVQTIRWNSFSPSAPSSTDRSQYGRVTHWAELRGVHDVRYIQQQTSYPAITWNEQSKEKLHLSISLPLLSPSLSLHVSIHVCCASVFVTPSPWKYITVWYFRTELTTVQQTLHEFYQFWQ